MEIGKSWTTEERAEIEVLCQQVREAFLRMDVLLGVEQPLSDLSTKDCLFVVGLQIEKMNRDITELGKILRLEQPQAEEEEEHHDRQ